MGKIMKRLVQQNILESQKGPSGGFLLNDATLGRFLVDVYKVTDHPEELTRCVLARGECSEENPCRLHPLIAPMKGPMFKILYETRVIDLLDGDNQELLNGLTVNYITG
jgi:DNA-binding IscR family transcriptional regulator